MTGSLAATLLADQQAREGCDQRRTNQDLLHLKRFKRLLGTEEKTWEENLKESGENAELRQKQEAWERREEQREDDRGASSTSREKREKKKKKVKDKKKEKKSKKAKVGGRAIARKKLVDYYSGTGLDPDPKVRRRLKRKLQRKLRKAKETSSSSSRTSSTSTSGEVHDEILEDRSKIQKLAELGPGTLAAAALQNMKMYVLQATGTTWDQDADSLPPIMTQYARQFLAAKASGGLLGEAVTLAHIVDLLLQARGAEALDCVSQRLKSLEMMMSGQAWTTSQKVEVVPALDATMSSRAEVQIAQKEAQLDSRTRGSGSTWDKGKAKGKGKEQAKGKEKGKTPAKGADNKKPS
eukprot:s1856_g2.t1